jgi:Sigma-70 region 2
MSLARFAFQACSFNHSDISPFKNNKLAAAAQQEERELCHTLQGLGITYGHFKYSRPRPIDERSARRGLFIAIVLGPRSPRARIRRAVGVSATMSNPFLESVENVADEELVAKAQEGDRDALERLLARHQPWILNIAVRMLGRRQDAEDVTQEVLIRVLKSLHTFRGDSKFRTWLYRIATTC